MGLLYRNPTRINSYVAFKKMALMLHVLEIPSLEFSWSDYVIRGVSEYHVTSGHDPSLSLSLTSFSICHLKEVLVHNVSIRNNIAIK